MHQEYYNYEWTWAIHKLEKYWKKTIDDVTSEDIVSLVERWKTSVVTLDQLIYNDAKKEFDLNSRTGYGVDGMLNKVIRILNRYVEISKTTLLSLKYWII